MKTEIAGFETHREGRTILLVRGALKEMVARSGITGLLREGGPTVEGRRGHAVLDLPGGGRAVVRHYVHGGLLRKVTGSTFAGSERFFREVRVSEHLRAHGVNTPEVLGLLVQAGRLGLSRASLVTRMIEGGRDLLTYLLSEDGRAQMTDPALKKAMIRTTANEVRKMHDSGVIHADLHVKNLLVTPEGSVFILDLDRARSRERVGPRSRLANLIRLGRSLEKTGADSVITGRDAYVFFLEYLRAGGAEKPLDIQPREVVRKYRRHVARHKLFWKLGIR